MVGSAQVWGRPAAGRSVLNAKSNLNRIMMIHDNLLLLTLNEETFLSASRGLRWGPDGWFGTNAACEEPRDSKPRFFFVWEFSPQYIPRPHWSRWRCRRRSRLGSPSPTAALSPHQRRSAIPRRTWAGRRLVNISKPLKEAWQGSLIWSFEGNYFDSYLTIPFPWQHWSSAGHPQWHVPPLQELRRSILLRVPHLGEIGKSKSWGIFQAFP